MFVPVALLKTDTAATREIAATSRAFLSMLHFYLFHSFLHFLQSLAACASCFQSPRLPGHSSVSILSPRTLFSPSQFYSLLSPIALSLSLWVRVLFPLFPPSESVHSLTQYCIERFPSLLSDHAVIEPERSRQIDFSEKDSVMFGYLLLPRAN